MRNVYLYQLNSSPVPIKQFRKQHKVLDGVGDLEYVSVLTVSLHEKAIGPTVRTLPKFNRAA